MKLHPEMTFRLTEFISLPLNVEIIKTGRSEDYLDSVDALLLITHCKQLWTAGRGLPIAILDTGQIRISDRFGRRSQAIRVCKSVGRWCGDWIFERDQLQGRSTLHKIGFRY